VIFFTAISAQSKNDLNSEEKKYISKFIYPIKTFNPDEGDNNDLLILDKLIGDVAMSFDYLIFINKSTSSKLLNGNSNE
jgi:hypothetical protein